MPSISGGNKIESSEIVDPAFIKSDLTNVKSVDKKAFINSMCRFIPEVLKVKDGSDYPGKTLYEMVTSIQKYLIENGLNWKLLDQHEFTDIYTVLDNVMHKRAINNIGQVTKQAEFISLDVEKSL